LKKDLSNFHQTNSSSLSLSKNVIPFFKQDLTNIVIPPEPLRDLWDNTFLHLEKE
jgi:hypothetical protein